MEMKLPAFLANYYEPTDLPTNGRTWMVIEKLHFNKNYNDDNNNLPEKGPDGTWYSTVEKGPGWSTHFYIIV